MSPYRKQPEPRRSFFSDRPEQHDIPPGQRSPSADAALAAARVTMVVAGVALSFLSFHASALVAASTFAGAFSFFAFHRSSPRP